MNMLVEFLFLKNIHPLQQGLRYISSENLLTFALYGRDSVSSTAE